MSVIERPPLKVAVHSILHDNDAAGYGVVGNRIYHGLASAGATMLKGVDFGWDTMLYVSPPRAAFVGPYPYRNDVCWHAMFEAEPMPRGWVNILNRAELLWSPSQWVRELFIDQGVTSPIFVQGYAVDGSMYAYHKREKTEPFRVGIWADNLVASRKNALMAVKTFVGANIPNSELDIKLNDPLTSNISTFTMDGKMLANVRIYSDPMPRWHLIEWIKSLHVGIYLSGGEGFGLMPLEMMATGLPMIVAHNTGMRDYLTPHVAKLVDCPTQEVSPYLTQTYDQETIVFRPDMDQAIDHLRWIYDHYDEALAMGLQAARHARRATWDDVGRNALTELEKVFHA